MPMRTTEMISAPTSVRQMLPTPPVIAVPPTTTAAIEGRRSSARERRRAAGQPAGKDDAGERGEGRRKDEGEDLLAVDLDAGRIGGRLACADGGAVAAEARTALQDVGDDQHDQPDDDDVGHAEHRAGDPGLVAARGFAERDRCSLEMTRAVLNRTPPMASVAMKEGIFSRTWARPERSPASAPIATASAKEP